MTLVKVLAAFLAMACVSFASRAEEFPDGVAILTAQEVTSRVSGKVFTVKLKDGASWRIDYKANGYYFFNHSRGGTDTGEWKTEDGKLCHNGRKAGPSCNEVRLKDDGLLLKRDNGDVVHYVENK